MNKTTVTGSLSEAGKIVISEPESRQLGSISLWSPWAQSLQAPVLLIPQGQASPGVTESCLSSLARVQSMEMKRPQVTQGPLCWSVALTGGQIPANLGYLTQPQ